ncbi:MAG: glycerate kinase [Cyanobacteria bacterium J06641_5]
MQTDTAILRHWLAGHPPSASDLDLLAASLDRDCLRAWDIPAGGIQKHLHKQAELLQAVAPQLKAASDRLGFAGGDRWLQTAWDLWLPLALKISARFQTLQRPLVWGILGLQGTGKTTLTRILQTILSEQDYSVLCLSIDDLYKPYRDRQALQAQDPRLVWRGPPGTHDVDLGVELLNRIRARQAPLQVPRFDKNLFAGAGDRTEPQTLTNPVDIVLFEGWFLGVRPIAPPSFFRAPWPIMTAADRLFARDCNARLAAYLPLWERLDALLALYPDDYRYSLQWRQEAEQQAKASGKGGMSDREVAGFVEYFWRSLHPELFVKPMLAEPTRVELAVALDMYRQPTRIYRPT